MSALVDAPAALATEDVEEHCDHIEVYDECLDLVLVFDSAQAAEEYGLDGTETYVATREPEEYERTCLDLGALDGW